MTINDRDRQTIGSSGILTKNELPLFFVLLSHADTKKNECYPSIAKLAKEAQASESTVKRILKSLEAKNVIKKEPQHRSDGSQSTNLYTVQISADFWGFKSKQKNMRNRAQNDSATLGASDKLIILDSEKSKSVNSVCQIEKPKSKAINKAKSAPMTAPRTEEKAAQIISMDEIRAKYRYAELVKAHETMTADIINPLFDKIFYALNETRETMTVKKGVVMPTKEVVRRINRLSGDNLETIIKRVAEGFEKIGELGVYLLNCLINFVDNTGVNMRREVNRDMRNNIAHVGSDETSPKELISVGEVKPDGTMIVNITRVESDRDKTQSEASTAHAAEVPGAEAPTNETLCMTQREAIDRFLDNSNPGKIDYDALMRVKDPRFRVNPAAYAV